MTIGSAASQPGHVTGALLPSFRSFAAAGLSPATLTATDPPRGRILVVEPQPAIALDLQRMLGDAGYRVVGPVGTAAEARQLIDRAPVDCALLDLDSHAVSAIGELSERGIPIVALASASVQDLPEVLRDRPLVRKPCRRDELLEAIERALAGSSDSGQVAYRLSPPPIPWPRVMPQL